MAGPGIKRDERIYGASLVDIAPTVLTLFDLPIGKDMDGRPLLEAFETTPKVGTIESWEKKPGESGMHAEGVALEPDQSRELMQQFAALGYIEDPGADKEKVAASAEIEAKYNIARTYLWKGRPDQARPLLEEIVRQRPWEDRFLGQLAGCYFQGGYLRQAEHVLAAITDDKEPDNPATLLLLAKIRLARGDLGGALQSVLTAEAMNPRAPTILTQIGDVFARLLQWKEAKTAYENAIVLDEDNALAFQGLSSVYRRLGLNQETADMALRAVGLLHRLPLAHFNLGVAMARSGENERAVLAFETALRFQPKMINAHRYLAMLCRQQGGDPEKAKNHQSEAANLARSRPQARRFDSDRSEKLFDLPEIPNREERLKILLRERPDPKPPEKKSGKTFILVSGLPRSGTSLMMQMLEAGGLTILTDHERAADLDNPKGYYEWEPLKQIGKTPELLDEDGLDRRGIKCVSMLLAQLPLRHNYKVIFMTRPIEEIVASQRQMIDRLGTRGASLAREDLTRGLDAHREETLAWLKRAPHMQFIEINYVALTKDPSPQIERVVEFVGREQLPNEEAMAGVIDPSLHRQRQA
jgi:tetratricopeptide (TPR) repeat protein